VSDTAVVVALNAAVLVALDAAIVATRKLATRGVPVITGTPATAVGEDAFNEGLIAQTNARKELEAAIFTLLAGDEKSGLPPPASMPNFNCRPPDAANSRAGHFPVNIQQQIKN